MPRNRITEVMRSKWRQKQDQLAYTPALIGDKTGLVDVADRPNYVWVQIQDSVVMAYCAPGINRSPGMSVMVGFRPEMPQLLQVMGISSQGARMYLGGNQALGKHHIQHEFPNSDAITISERQFSPLKITLVGAFLLTVLPGFVWIGESLEYISVTEPIDLTLEVPLTAGKAKLIWFVIDNTGVVVTVNGSEVDFADLDTTVVPTFASSVCYILGAVRLYAGQNQVWEGLDSSDILDLRFPMRNNQASGGGGHVIQSDGTDMPTQPKLNFVGATLTDDTVNQATVVTVPTITRSSTDLTWFIDGSISAVTAVPEYFVMPRDSTIDKVIAVLANTGSSGTTTVDVNLSGTTIFTTQANRPLITAGGARSSSGVPDVVTLHAGDLITLDIDSAAVGASGLTVILAMSVPAGGGGGGSSTTAFGPDIPPASPNAMDDEFNSLTLNSKWTQVNYVSGSATESFEYGRYCLYSVPAARSAYPVVGLIQPIVDATWKFRGSFSHEGPSRNYQGAGMLLRNTAGDRVLWFGPLFHSSYGYHVPFLARLTDYNTYSSETNGGGWFMGQRFYMELENDGTTLTMRLSADGSLYVPAHTEALASFIVSVADIGPGMWIVGAGGSTTVGMSCDWFRRMA